MFLLQSAPPPVNKFFLFAEIFVVVLVVVIVLMRRTEKKFAEPYEAEARRIGPVRCDDCKAEGPLVVSVRVRTRLDPIPQPTGASLLCATCRSPSWTPISKLQS